jgi:hypothetical protein
MKKLFILTIIIALCCSGCTKQYIKHLGPDFDEYLTVEEYINFLADDKYEHTFIPALGPDDISYLLEFSRSELMLENFPRNPVSSFAQSECKLGFVALWTIESIRKSYGIEDIDKYDRFPSSNSVLVDRDSFSVHTEDSILQLCADHYQEWWDRHNLADFNKYRFIDPLEGTNLRWK